jgi:hypothetical protein
VAVAAKERLNAGQRAGRRLRGIDVVVSDIAQDLELPLIQANHIVVELGDIRGRESSGR